MSSHNVANLNSKTFGTRLSAHPSGYVNLSGNNGLAEQWEWQWISPNKFFWKSKAYGTYLRAWPDGHLDLTTNRDAWEVWTKHDCGSHIFWQSHFGTFLCSNPNNTVCLTGNKLAHEFWTHWGCKFSLKILTRIFDRCVEILCLLTILFITWILIYFI